MKYVIVLDDQVVDKNADGTPYVIVRNNKYETFLKLIVTPIVKPILIHPMEPDTALYLTQEHVDALCKYEQDVMLKELIDKMNEDYGFPKYILNVEDLRHQFGLPVENNAICELKKENNDG